MIRTANALAGALVLHALTAAATVGNEGLHQERATVREQLSAERTALTSAREQKVQLLEALEFTERLARASAARARALDSELVGLSGQVQFVRREREAARVELGQLLQRIQPRLFVLYRMTHEHPLKPLLSANDFSSLMWRWRAMTGLLSRDFESLRAAKRLADFGELLASQLEGLETDLGRWRDLSAIRGREAAARRRELAELVAALRADALQSKRIIAELEEEDRALTNLIKALQMARSSGFPALKGHLPLPTEGVLEVGFGKVINPKFNTVTVQKGWDIRAEEGSLVRAIATGQVVHAGWLRGYGNVLIIDHGGGFHSLVAHLASFARATGESVEGGEAVGTVGDTGSLKGAYLYFEIRQDGEAVDPAAWVSDSAALVRARRGRGRH
jgi:septal ring factor EnvC (AmiA/AmiB activator)